MGRRNRFALPTPDGVAQGAAIPRASLRLQHLVQEPWFDFSVLISGPIPPRVVVGPQKLHHLGQAGPIGRMIASQVHVEARGEADEDELGVKIENAVAQAVRGELADAGLPAKRERQRCSEVMRRILGLSSRLRSDNKPGLPRQELASIPASRSNLKEDHHPAPILVESGAIS